MIGNTIKNKILLINPPRFHGLTVVRETRCCGFTFGSVYPPLRFAYTAGLLRKKRFEVSIIDANALNLNFDDIKNSIEELKPTIVIFSTSLPTFSNDCKIAEICSEIDKEILVVLDDQHIAPILPEKIFQKFRAIDVLIRGESEFTVLDLAGNINSLEKVKGISYQKDGKIINNPPREATNLDDLPFPAYDLLPVEKYTSVSCSRKKPFVSIITSVHCPYHCTFCIMSMAEWRGYGKWRTRSPEKVLDEIAYLYRDLGVKSVYFFDETFTMDKEHVKAICQGLLKRGIKIEWACNSRIDTIDEEMLRLMAEAGCWKICYGVESASEQLLGKVHKGYDVNDVKKIFQATKKQGIVASASFIIGLPGETPSTIEQTLKLAKEINPPKAQFVICTPYPGTKLYHYVKENNLLDKDYSFDSYDAYGAVGEPVMHTEKMTAKQIKEAQKRIQKEFYFRPYFILKTLFNIKSFAELKNLIRAGKYIK